MKSKSIRKALLDASTWIDVLRITRAELICVSVYGTSTTQMQLSPAGFARVMAALRIPRSKINLRVRNGHAHATCDARGVQWSACAELTAEQWQALLAQGQGQLAAQGVAQLALDA